MRLSGLLALVGLLTLVTGTPVAPARPQAQPHLQPQPIRARQSSNSTAPCAQVSQAMYSSTPAKFQIPAKLAYDCIKSVPLNVSSAKRLLEALPTYINWQSTLTTLANPPAEYAEKVQPATDILGGLKQIATDIDAGKYAWEYDFGWALYTLVQGAHDGHFSYVPDSVGTMFSWGRPMPLVSVSEDGKKLPSVFTFPDVLGMQFKNITYTPSPVVEIDGQPVTAFLENWSQYGSLQDRDALYNNVFYELAQVSLASSGSGTGTFTGGGRGRYVYPGATTTLKFANGTTYTMENYALVHYTMRNINTGEDLAKYWFNYGNAFAQTESEGTVAEQAVVAAAPGYPVPIVPGPSNLINGFYIDGAGYEEYAVLQVPNFVGDPSAEIGFQQTTQQFLPKALADGKTKLIIDLQANGGGTILQGYDMFKQLFPQLDPYGANRFRAIEAVDLIGQSFSQYGSQFPRSASSNTTVKTVQGSYFDYHADMTVDGKPFDSWDEKFGPVETNGDKYTTTARWNLNDPLIPWNSGGINITGYGPLANVSQSPFKAENIVIVTDGYCASTCTIFSEFMRKQAGVKTIALGGRSNTNQIQAIGGVKGVNNYAFSYIQTLAGQAVSIATGDLKTQLNSSVLTDYRSDLVFNRAASTGGVNVRDGLAQNDTSGIALQFKYEEADCRLYYTPEMTVDVQAIWKAAADANWGMSGQCVKDNYGKREAHEVTTKLKPRRVQVASAAVALKKFEAFEKSFALETECRLTGDGFMAP